MDHAGDFYALGFDAGAAGLPSDLTGLDDLAASLYLSGYADASREVIDTLCARLLGPVAASREQVA